METNEKAYIKLQKHLNNQAVGFPSTRSGVEIKILKHIFTPEEAEITSHLSYRPEPIAVIYPKVSHLVQSPGDLEKKLDHIQKKGGIETKVKIGQKHYCCLPLVVGMYELQLERLTPAFIQNFKVRNLRGQFTKPVFPNAFRFPPPIAHQKAQKRI